MSRKTIILGVILATFMMLMIPNISAVNEQVKEENTNFNLLNKIQNKEIDGPINNFLMSIFGMIMIGMGILCYILLFSGLAFFIDYSVFVSVCSGIINAIFSIFGGNNFLEILLDGISGSIGGFGFLLIMGIFYIRYGLYMIKNKEMPDENTYKEWPVIYFIIKLMTPGQHDNQMA